MIRDWERGRGSTSLMLTHFLCRLITVVTSIIIWEVIKNCSVPCLCSRHTMPPPLSLSLSVAPFEVGLDKYRHPLVFGFPQFDDFKLPWSQHRSHQPLSQHHQIIPHPRHEHNPSKIYSFLVASKFNCRHRFLGDQNGLWSPSLPCHEVLLSQLNFSMAAVTSNTDAGLELQLPNMLIGLESVWTWWLSDRQCS